MKESNQSPYTFFWSVAYLDNYALSNNDLSLALLILLQMSVHKLSLSLSATACADYYLRV